MPARRSARACTATRASCSTPDVVSAMRCAGQYDLALSTPKTGTEQCARHTRTPVSNAMEPHGWPRAAVIHVPSAATADDMLTQSSARCNTGEDRSLSEAAGDKQTMSSENNGWGARKAVVLQGSASRFAAATTALEIAVPSDAATAVRFRSRSWTNTCASIVVCTGRNQNPAERRLAGRSGTDFATIWGTFCDAIFCASLSRSCAFCAHFLRILCIFGALGQMQWMHRPADRASRPGVAKYRNAAFVVHFTCIYVHLRTRMQNACRMHVNLHKMALAKLQVHSPDAILPRSSPDHPSPASECHPDRHRGRWLRMHMDALRVHRRECECGRCSLPCSLKCAEGVLNAH